MLGGLIYIDPSNLRRTTITSSASNMPPPSNTSNTSNEHAHSTTSSRLARAHGIVVRQIADLLAMLPNYRGLASLSESLDVSPEDVTGLQVSYKLSFAYTFLYQFIM